ncbi:hypothetical protein ABK040_010141 [Willaertia magna]
MKLRLSVILLLVSLTVCCLLVGYATSIQLPTSINWSSCPSSRKRSTNNNVVDNNDFIGDKWEEHFSLFPQSQRKVDQLLFNTDNKLSTFITNDIAAEPEYQCATLSMPLDWDNYATDSRNVSISISALFVPDPSKRKGQLYIVAGGPGESSVLAFTSTFMKSIRDTVLEGTHDIIAVDARGTGYSNYLGCSYPQSSSCYDNIKGKYGDLKYFSTTSTAKDYLHIFSLIGSESDQRIVWGISYGTFLTNRILYLDGLATKKRVTAGILDSPVPANVDFFTRSDQYAEIGNKLVDMCKADTEFCSKNFNSNVAGIIDSVWKSSNRCLPYFDNCVLAIINSVLIDNVLLRKLILPVYQRIHSCTENDKAWLQKFASITQLQNSCKTSFVANPNTPTPLSVVTLNVVGCSELIPRVNNNGAYSGNFGINKIQEVYTMNSYPPYNSNVSLDLAITCNNYMGSNAYEVDSTTRESAANTFTGPVLILQGMLDPRTPPSWGKHVSKQFTDKGRNVHYVEFEGVKHFVGANSQTTDGKYQCGYQVINSFIKGGFAKPDTSCLSKLVPFSFKENQYDSGTYSALELLPLFSTTSTAGMFSYNIILIVFCIVISSLFTKI